MIGTVLAPLVLGTAVALAWLVWTLRRSSDVRLSTWGSVFLIVGWLALSVYLLRQVNLDERYTPELGYPAAAETLRREARRGDVLIADLWTENLNGPVTALINYCRGGCPPRVDLVRENLTDREQDWETRHRADLAGYDRAWLALERVVEGDRNSIVERWLGDVGFWTGCTWSGPQVRLCRYDLAEGAPVQAQVTKATLGEDIELTGAEVRLNGVDAAEGYLLRGDTVQMTLRWRAMTPPQADLLLSLQLLRPDGSLAAGLDRRPGNGFHPTPDWKPGEEIVDRLALDIPQDAPEGAYALTALMYDAQTGVRLPVETEGGVAGDVIVLAQVVVRRAAVPGMNRDR